MIMVEGIGIFSEKRKFEKVSTFQDSLGKQGLDDQGLKFQLIGIILIRAFEKLKMSLKTGSTSRVSS